MHYRMLITLDADADGASELVRREAFDRLSRDDQDMTKKPIRPTIPPDPEGMNDRRSAWAGAAIRAFRHATGTDEEDVLCDLLADLMHWADRHNYDFGAALLRGQDHYEAETAGEQS